MTEKKKKSMGGVHVGSQGIRRVPLRSALEGDRERGIKKPSPRNHPSPEQIEERVHAETRAIEREIGRERSGGKWFRLICFLALIVGVALGLTYFFARAEVSVVPKQASFPVSLAATAYDRPTEGQLRFETLTKTISKETTLTATETEYQELRASGKIRIFNTTASAQTFVEETRFQASDGKIYKTGKGVRVTVPGKKGSIPGSVDATVYAAEPGPTYNKDMDDFTIPGFKGSPKFTAFTARSLTPMTGGFSGNTPIISEASITAAVTSLKTDLADDVLSSLREQTPDTFVILPGGLKTGEISSEIDRTKPGGVLVRVSQPTTFILFDRENLTDYLAKALVAGYDSSRDHLAILDMSTIRVAVPETIPEDAAQIHVVFDGTATFAWLTDQSLISSKLMGVAKRDISSTILSIPTIERADVVLKPVWLMRVPKKVTNISVLAPGTYEKEGINP